MAIVSCPECSKKLKVADTSIGKKVKCTCGNVFVAQESAPNPGMSAAIAGADAKVTVACTECSAKLKVAATSLGKKMKCPKCTGIFIAAALDEEPPPVKKATPVVVADEPEEEEIRPKAKAKRANDDDDDFMAFAQQDAAAENEGGMVFTDEEEMPKPKGKAKPQPAFEDDEEEEKPKPKGKGAKPPRMEDEDQEKPVYASRMVPNLLTALLLLGYATFFGLFVAGIIPPLMPKSTPPPPKRQIAMPVDQNQLNKEEAAQFDGTWIVESAAMPKLSLDALKGKKFIFANGKVTTPDTVDAPFTVDAGQDPKWIELPTAAGVNVPGIYKLDGDSLQWCTALPKEVVVNGKKSMQAGARPTKFDATEGMLIVLKRAKKDDDKKSDGDKTKDKDKTKPATGKIDGVWVAEYAEEYGRSDKKPIGQRFTFANGKAQFPDTPPGGFAYKIDASKKPMWLDFEVPGFATIPGIFKIEGGKLHWAFSAPGKDGKIGPRPNTFDSKSGNYVVLRPPTKEELNTPVTSHRLSQNNLKQIGLALHTYHDANKHLPPAAIYDAAGKPLLSWRVAILPYIDQVALFKEFDLTKPWNDPHNQKLIAKMPQIYVVPGTDGKSGKTHYRVFVGPGTPLEPQKGPGGRLIGRTMVGLADGTSNCIVVVEAKEPIEWTRPDDLPYDPKAPLPKLGVAPDGFNVLFVDARVQLVPPTIAENILRPYLTCNNGIPRQPLEIGKGKDDTKGKKGAEKPPPPEAKPAKQTQRQMQESAWVAEYRKMPPTDKSGAVAWLPHPGVLSMAFARTAPFLASVNEKDGVTIWDLRTVKSLKIIAAPLPTKRAIIALSPNGELVALVSDQEKFGRKVDIRVWKVADGALVKSVTVPSAIPFAKAPVGLQFTSDGKRLTLLIQDQGFEATSWEIAGWKEKKWVPDGKFGNCYFSASGDTLYECFSREQTLTIRDLATDKKRTVNMKRTLNWNDRVTPDGKSYLDTKAGPFFDRLQLVNLETGAAEEKIATERMLVNRVQFSTDGKYLLYAVADTETKLLDIAARKTVWSTAGAPPLAFSPGGVLVVRINPGGVQLLALEDLLAGKK